MSTKTTIKKENKYKVDDIFIVSDAIKDIKKRIGRKEMLNDVDIMFFSYAFAWMLNISKEDLIVIDPVALRTFINSKDDPNKFERQLKAMKTILDPFFGYTKTNKVVIFPLHHKTHWSLLLFINYIDGKKLWCRYDSFSSSHKDYIQQILSTFTKHNILKTENHKYVKRKVPKQKGLWECGVYILMYIYLVMVHRNLIPDNKLKNCNDNKMRGMVQRMTKLISIFEDINKDMAYLDQLDKVNISEIKKQKKKRKRERKDDNKKKTVMKKRKLE
jgi:hypothetical protein